MRYGKEWYYIWEQASDWSFTVLSCLSTALMLRIQPSRRRLMTMLHRHIFNLRMHKLVACSLISFVMSRHPPWLIRSSKQPQPRWLTWSKRQAQTFHAARKLHFPMEKNLLSLSVGWIISRYDSKDKCLKAFWGNVMICEVLWAMCFTHMPLFIAQLLSSKNEGSKTLSVPGLCCGDVISNKTSSSRALAQYGASSCGVKGFPISGMCPYSSGTVVWWVIFTYVEPFRLD